MDASLFQVIYYGYRLLHPLVQVSATLPLAQAVHESANFTSHVYTEYHNMFGMNAPTKRDTTALNRGSGKMATFGSPADSIADYLLWLESNKLYTDAALQQFISAGKYAEDKQYPAKIAARVKVLAAAGAYYSPAQLGVAAAAGTVAIVGGIAVAVNHLTT